MTKRRDAVTRAKRVRLQPGLAVLVEGARWTARAVASDISFGGMGLTLEQAPEIGEELSIEVPAWGASSPPMNATVRGVREHERGADLDVRFWGLEARTLEQIGEIVGADCASIGALLVRDALAADSHYLVSLLGGDDLPYPGSVVLSVHRVQASAHPVQVSEDAQVIGRSRELSLHFAHSRLSRRHASIGWHPSLGGFVVTDLGSRNGTYLNDLRVSGTRPAAMRSGDVVSFGGARFLFASGAELRELLRSHWALESRSARRALGPARTSPDKTQLGHAFIDALVRFDLDLLRPLCEPDIQFRYLLPNDIQHGRGVDALTESFRGFFSGATIEELGRQVDTLSDRLHLGYRFRLHRHASQALVEQQVYAVVDHGRFTRLDCLCSGARPDIAARLGYP